jgi:hypothetical protein
MAFNSAGVTDLRARPRPGTDSLFGVLAILGLADVRGGEGLRLAGVDFRLFACGAVAGAILARAGWDEVDCDSGCEAEGVFVDALLFLGLLAFGVVDGGVDFVKGRPMTISTLSLGLRGEAVSVICAISNGDRSRDGPASSTRGDFFRRGLGEISWVGDAVPFSSIEGAAERRGGVGAGRGRTRVREMVSSISVPG